MAGAQAAPGAATLPFELISRRFPVILGRNRGVSALKTARKGAKSSKTEVISAVGAIGSEDDERNNGLTNELAAAAAKVAGAKRFVLVSASKEPKTLQKS